MADDLTQGDQLVQSLNTTTTAAPALVKSPGSAIDVARSGGDTVSRAQAISHVQTSSAVTQAAQAHSQGDGGFWGSLAHLGHDALGVVGDVGKAGLAVLNYPLQTVQHEFRYFYAVGHEHGLGAALAEVAVAAAGAAVAATGVGAIAEGALGAGALATAGTFLGQAAGARLGGQATSWLEGHAMFRNLWDQTADGNTYKVNGHNVSFGRMLAGLVGLKPGSGSYTLLSGLSDGLFDIGLDPVQIAGNRFAAFREAKYMPRAENIDWAMDHPGLMGSFHRAIEDMAHSDAGQILARYPQFKDMAYELEDAKTKDEVAAVIRNRLHAAEFVQAERLPSMGYFHNLTSAARRRAAESPGALSGAARQVKVVGRPLGAIVGLASPRRWADRFNPLPTELDWKAMRFKDDAIDPTGKEAPAGLFHLVRYGQSEQVARYMVDEWRDADVRTRGKIFTNAIIDATFGLAGKGLQAGEHAATKYSDVLQSPEFRQKVRNLMDEAMVRGDPDATGVYGLYTNGKAILPVKDAESGAEIGAGILDSQKFDWRLPDMSELKKLSHAVAHSKDIYGNVDDWVARYFTNAVFKRFVLQSVSYALHITGAETAMNVMRQGLGHTISARFYQSYAHLGWKIEMGGDSQTVRILQRASGVFGHQIKSLDELRFNLWLRDVFEKIPTDPEKLQFAAELQGLTDGTGTPYAVSAGHSYGEAEVQRERYQEGLKKRAGNRPMRDSRRYTVYGPESRRYMRDWRRSVRVFSRDEKVQKSSAAYLDALRQGKSAEEADLAARDAWAGVLEGRSDEELSGFERAYSKPEGDPEHWTPLESWAHHGWEATKGVAFAPDGTPNMGIVRHLADRSNNPLNDRYFEKVDHDRRPLGVMGRVEVPNLDGSLARIASFGFRGLNKIVQEVSREPMFFNEYVRERKLTQELEQKGILNHDEAVSMAAARATKKAVRFVHNLHDRTQLSSTLRNWAPFWFAQEQAYRRMGRMLAENSGAFRKYQLLLANVHDMAVQQQDSSGNKYFVLPGLGWMDAHIAPAFAHLGLPIANVNPVEFGGSWDATSVMFPLTGGTNLASAMRPGWSPLAVIPAKAAFAAVSAYGKSYAGFQPVATQVDNLIETAIGGASMSQSVIGELIPNTLIQRTYEAISGYAGNPDNSFISAMDQSMQSLQYQQNVAVENWEKNGRKGPMPSIVPGSDASYAQKQAFISRVKNMTLINLMGRAMIGFFSPVSAELEENNFGLTAKLNAAIKAAGSVNVGMQNFLSENPNATPYTVAQSQHPGSAASLPDSVDGQAWLDANRAFVQRYPNAAMYFVPQFQNNNYNQSVYNEQLADGLRVKDTPSEFLDALYTAAGDQVYFANLPVHEAALSQVAKGTPGYDREEANWQAYVAQLQVQMPTWAANTTLFSMQRQTEAQQTIQQLQQIFASGNYPKGYMADGIGSLLQNYESAANDYAVASQSYNYAHQQSLVKESWTKYLDALKVSNPELKPIISSVFSGVFYQVK